VSNNKYLSIYGIVHADRVDLVISLSFSLSVSLSFNFYQAATNIPMESDEKYRQKGEWRNSREYRGAMRNDAFV